MRRFTSSFVFSALATVVAIGTTGETARAQCNFDAPAKARGLKASFVRVYAGCGPSITFGAPTSETSDGLPACTPPTPPSAYEFDDSKGECSIRTKHKVKTPCPDEVAASCSSLRVTVKCMGILDPGGAAPTNTAGWVLGMLSRLTIWDSAGGDMTTVDLPSQFALPDIVDGKVKATFDVGPCEGPLCGPFDPSSFALPPCTQLAIRSLTLHDPSGIAFAKVGLSGR